MLPAYEHGLTRETIQETMRICQEKGVLMPFLATRRKEVVDIMEMLFSQEEVWEMTKREIKREAKKEGEEMRDNLYGELMKKLAPLGRINDLIAATADKAKLSDLARVFGLQV